MKIAYLAKLNVTDRGGVLQKIYSQCTVWQNCGIQIKVFIITPELNAQSTTVNINNYVRVHRKGRISRFKTSIEMSKCIKSWKPDIIYSRDYKYDPFLYNLFTSFPTIFEINSNDIAEKKKTMHAFKYLLYIMTRKIILKRARAFVAVTDELKRCFLEFKKPILCVANGIDLSKYEVVKPTNNVNPVLTFLGSPNQPWHGVDKILILAHEFNSWEFNIIGYKESEFKTRLPYNISAAGYLNQQEYYKIITKTDIGIGTLALHRKSMEEACPLKVRECLAYGLPMIIGYCDNDFVEPSDFILQLPNCEENIRPFTEKISEFVERWKGKRVKREEIKHLDIINKEKQKIEFFQSV